MDAGVNSPDNLAYFEAMHAYAEGEIARGTALRSITRHMLGLYHGAPGARRWRRALSDPTRLARNDPSLLREALEEVEGGVAAAA